MKRIGLCALLLSALLVSACSLDVDDETPQDFETFLDNVEVSPDGDYVTETGHRFQSLEHAELFYDQAYLGLGADVADESEPADYADEESNSLASASPSMPAVIPTFANCSASRVARYFIDVVPLGSVTPNWWDVQTKTKGGSWRSIHASGSFPAPTVSVTVGSTLSVRVRACQGWSCSGYRVVNIKGSCSTKAPKGPKKLPPIPGPPHPRLPN